jgi:hypothetical protein
MQSSWLHFWQIQLACNAERLPNLLFIEVFLRIGTSSQAVQCPTPLMKVKDGGFQHHKNHANCRSKGKIKLYLVDHLVGAFAAFYYEVLGGLHLA